MKRLGIAAVGLALVVGVVAVACSREVIPEVVVTPTDEESAIRATSTTIPPPADVPGDLQDVAFEEFVPESQDYTVDFPADWVAVPGVPVELYGEEFVLDMFLNPALDEDFSANVNIFWVPAVGRTMDQVEKLETEVTLADVIDVQKSERAELAGRDVLVLHYTDRLEGYLVDLAQLMFIQDDREWVFSLGAAPGYRDEYLPILHRMFESFRPRQ